MSLLELCQCQRAEMLLDEVTSGLHQQPPEPIVEPGEAAGEAELWPVVVEVRVAVQLRMDVRMTWK